jgi:hypothetical protein
MNWKKKISEGYEGDMPALSSVSPSPESIACDLTYISTVLKSNDIANRNSFRK